MSAKTTKIYMICVAYESGVGHGMRKNGYKNPYRAGTEEHEAWGYGYKEGEDKAGETLSEMQPNT